MSSKHLRAWVFGAIVAAASFQAGAAGLGKLNVNSVLGEPLNAEVAVLAQPEELQSLKVKLASPQAYEAAGLVHTDLISQVAVTLRLEGSDRAVVSISSAAPINDPVLDLLLELSWSSGRVTREYTAFIDPPFIAAEREQVRMEESIASNRTQQPGVIPETTAASARATPTPEPLPEESVTEAVVADSGISEPVMQDGAAADAESLSVETIGGTAPTLFGAAPTMSNIPAGDGMSSDISGQETVATDDFGYIEDRPIGVIRGDTLSKIALANKPAGVTLDQMLVVLFRNNPKAFSGNNMNRLRTGKIIQLANPEEYLQVTPEDARQEVRIQTTSWRAYKERVAAVAMERAEQAPTQAAGGAVSPQVQEATPSAAGASTEVVKLSRGEPATAGQGANGGDSTALQEKLVSTEKALEDSNARVARLKK